MSLYQIGNRADERKEKGTFICLDEVGGNGRGDILDFKTNICYQCSSKESKCRKCLCFLESPTLVCIDVLF